MKEVAGRRNFDSEEVIATELGYRIEATEKLSFDLALFYNDYAKLGTFDVQDPSLDLLSNPARANALGREARARMIARYGWDARLAGLAEMLGFAG